ncbi:MAG TPA: 16S rRNA (guanine(527)-N(7))-methyltransferase RsmG [Egibacteraceae bacterium]|nr:16S rRNA (guanine(527)-N(7))-methyltransferase RsmG [Egibacteraceae bacterium]
MESSGADGPDWDDAGVAGAAGVPLTPQQTARLDRLAALIAASPHNLISRGERPTVRERHVAECAALAPLLPATDGQSWIDVGTGGGLPGLVLAIVQPDIRWTLLDATRKKVAAVRAFAEELAVHNVRVIAARAEALAHDPAHREQFDGAVSRALAPLPTLMELCRGFVPPGGVIAAVKGARWEEEVSASAHARQALEVGEIRAMAVPGTIRPTWLLTMRASGPTPRLYPRGQGRPRTKPLGWSGAASS